MDKGRDSSRYSINVEKGKGYERPQSLPSPKLPSPRLPSPKHLSPNRFGGSEAQSVPNPEKGKGSEPVQISDKSHQSSEKLKKSDSQPAHHSDGWNQQPKHLERGRSEGHQTYNVDKGRWLKGLVFFCSRTWSTCSQCFCCPCWDLLVFQRCFVWFTKYSEKNPSLIRLPQEPLFKQEKHSTYPQKHHVQGIVQLFPWHKPNCL